MSEDRIKMRWVRYVVRGEGKARSDSNERFSYRGPVLYSNEWPVARLVHGPTKDWVLVSKNGGHVAAPKEWKDDGKPTLDRHTQYVPCIGVFSKFEGDMVPDDKLHERIQWLAHLEAQRWIEDAQAWPADKLLVKSYSGTGSDDLIKNMKRTATRYEQYSGAFMLGWTNFPTHYMDDLMSVIEMRKKAYFSPKMEEQRIRQRARADAKKALFG